MQAHRGLVQYTHIALRGAAARVFGGHVGFGQFRYQLDALGFAAA